LKDKNNIEIKIGDKIKTNEAGWIGTVVKFGDFFYLGDIEKAVGWSLDMLVLIDDKGGFSFEPEWDKCEVLK